jgi:hypothetical protein
MLDSEIYDDSVRADEQRNAEPEKRNCGRTGPTSAEGRAASSKNAIKHGACAQTLILPCESEESWLLLLSRWCKTYQPPEDSLLYDFVLKTAQAEWYRIRAHRNLESFMAFTQGRSPFNWTPDEIKKHDLCLRYATAAERAFQREFRLLEQFCKLHPAAPAHKPADPEPEGGSAASRARLTVVGEDPTSPTGLTLLLENIGGVENTTQRPYYPPAQSAPDRSPP